MATRTRNSGALAVAQLDTATVGGTIEVGDLFKVTVGAKTLSYAAASTVAATVATGLAAALQALLDADYPELTDLTFAPSGATVTCTSDVKGKAFVMTVATTESNGDAADAQTFSTTTTTANAGPSTWLGDGNWGGTAPGAADDAVLEASTIDILYGLSQAGATLASLTIKHNFEGWLGNIRWHDDGYPEYRDTELIIDASIVTIGEGDGSGSGLIRLNQGTVQTAVTVHQTGPSDEDGAPAVCWRGTHASNTVTVLAGEVGIAFFGGQTAVVATLRNVAGNVICGVGCTLTTVELGGQGTIELRSACTTLNLQDGAGTVTLRGSGSITSINCWGGTCDVRRATTITALNVRGTVDFTNAPGAVTVTACVIQSGGTILDPNKRVTWSNGIVLDNCTLDDVTLDLGADRTLTPS